MSKGTCRQGRWQKLDLQDTVVGSELTLLVVRGLLPVYLGVHMHKNTHTHK